MKISIIFLVVAALTSGRTEAREALANAGGPVSFAAEEDAGPSSLFGASRGAGGMQVPVQKKASTRFADGRLDEYIIFQYDQNDVLLLFQTRYSASGTLVETVEFTYENNRPVQKTVKDEQGRPQSMVSYQYNPQGFLVKETLSDRSGKALSSYEYQYDANGNRVVRIISNIRGGKLAETSFIYRNGLLVSSETRDGTGRKTGSSESTYDSSGNRITETVFNATGDVVRVINETWQNGLEIKLERVDAGGRVQLRETYEYGAHDELVRKTVEDFRNQTKKVVEYEYTFREEQRP